MATNPSYWGREPVLGPAPRRVRSRAPLALPALVGTAGIEKRARLRDLSTSGAMVETPDKLELGAEVTLRCGGLQRTGTIVWGHLHRSGIQFHAPLDERDIELQLARSEQVVTNQRLRAGGFVPVICK